MPTSNLLSTNDLNLKQLLGNGRVYRVPPFQRDYSWKEEHWEDLWLDLEDLAKDPEAQHYMGSVVLKREGAEEFVIIDGQQRIATISILILAAIDRLNRMGAEGIDSEANRQRGRILRQNFIGTTDPGSLTESSKLSLNAHDDPFYQGTLVQLEQPASERALSDSERLLWGAFKYYRTRIEEAFAKASGQQIADWVNQLVAVRLLFIQVSVQDELSAYMVFETLNARGLELTAGDLIKNYLLSLVARRGTGDLKHIQNKWSLLSSSIGAQKLPEFLRHYINSLHPFVRQERLFRHVRDQIKSPEAAIRLIRELEKASVCYRALSAPEDEFWFDFPGASEHVRNLVMFGVSQFRPLILAVVRQFKSADVVRVLRDCEILSLRFNIISRLGTHELENRYNAAALAVESKAAKDPSAVRDALRAVYVDDEQFRNDFEVLRQDCTPKGKRIIRYVLCALERQHSQDDVSWHATDSTIEHVLPEHLDVSWESEFTEADHLKYVDRLGNYALLERGKNRDLGQKAFELKKAVFAESQYALTREIAKFDEWNKHAIAQRQKRLASLATTVWKFAP